MDSHQESVGVLRAPIKRLCRFQLVPRGQEARLYQVSPYMVWTVTSVLPLTQSGKFSVHSRQSRFSLSCLSSTDSSQRGCLLQYYMDALVLDFTVCFPGSPVWLLGDKLRAYPITAAQAWCMSRSSRLRVGLAPCVGHSCCSPLGATLWVECDAIDDNTDMIQGFFSSSGFFAQKKAEWFHTRAVPPSG